nr:MAG TPA: hypothetical protein [Caudoviricetes sp.]
MMKFHIFFILQGSYVSSQNGNKPVKNFYVKIIKTVFYLKVFWYFSL